MYRSFLGICTVNITNVHVPSIPLYSNLLDSITFIIVISKCAGYVACFMLYLKYILFVHIVIVGERNKQEKFFIFNASIFKNIASKRLDMLLSLLIYI